MIQEYTKPVVNIILTWIIQLTKIRPIVFEISF